MDDGLQNHEWCSLNRGCVIGWNSKFCLQNAPLSLNLLPCEHFTPLILILWVMVCIPSALKDHKCEPRLVYWESANVMRFYDIFCPDLAIYFVEICWECTFSISRRFDREGLNLQTEYLIVSTQHILQHQSRMTDAANFLQANLTWQLLSQEELTLAQGRRAHFTSRGELICLKIKWMGGMHVRTIYHRGD